MRESLRKLGCWLFHRRQRLLMASGPLGLHFFPFDFEDVVYCYVCDAGKGSKGPAVWATPSAALGAA